VRLVCDDLPEKFVETSLSVEGTGLTGARIVGIDMRRTEKSEVDSPRFKELSEEHTALDMEIARLGIRRSALQRRRELARSIGDFASEQGQEDLAEGRFTPSYWDGFLTFFETENVTTEDRIRDLEIEVRELEMRRGWIRSELNSMQAGEGPGREVIVDCETDSGGSLTVELSYLVPDASWYPEYTVRYIEHDSEVELTYAARISQATGEDWRGVEALLSTATPHVGAAPPDLIPLYVGGTTGSVRGRVTDASTGAPLPYADVLVVGTPRGGTADKDGVYAIAEVPAGTHTVQFSYMGYKTVRKSRVRVSVGRVARVDVALEPMPLVVEEMAVMADRAMIAVEPTSTSRTMAAQPGIVHEGELHLRGGRSDETRYEVPAVPHVEAEVLGSEFAANLVIPLPIDLETGAEPRRSLVVRKRIPGSFVLRAVPRLSEHVFVRGTLENPLDVPLLPGAAETYVETRPEGSNAKISNFVGKDRIDAVAPGEQFEMYLGIDQNVKVAHELAKKEVLSKASSKTTKVRYSYVITAESFRRGAAEIQIEDRVPVSVMREVKIDDLKIEPEPDELTEEGLATWRFKLNRGESREVSIAYVVEYPSHMSSESLGLEE
jgi:hypothetical protein